jgi:hypothetical protein
MIWAIALAAAAAAVECPAGSMRKQMHSGEGQTTKACVDASGALHGKAQTLDAAGVLIAEDEWKHGVKEGVWTTFYGPSRPHSRVTYAAGKRKGAYSEWEEQGGQVVWGWFEDDHEDGPWFILSKEGAIIATFEGGADVTDATLAGAASCNAFAAKSPQVRRGAVAAMALLAVQRLDQKSQPRGAEQWSKAGVCLLDGSRKAAADLDARCKALDASFASIGGEAASKLAFGCLKPH